METLSNPIQTTKKTKGKKRGRKKGFKLIKKTQTLPQDITPSAPSIMDNFNSILLACEKHGVEFAEVVTNAITITVSFNPHAKNIIPTGSSVEFSSTPVITKAEPSSLEITS